MYYVKIPLRNLCEAHELKVADGEQQARWQRRVASLLDDLRQGIIPAWAVNYADLCNLVLLREEGDDG